MSSITGPGRKSLSPRRYSDRTGTRSAAAMRGGEGLVQIVMHHIKAEIAGPRDTARAFHIGAVAVDEAAALVHQPHDLADVLSNRPSVFGLVIMMPATVSSQAMRTASRSILPRASEGSSSAVKPAMVVEAGLVPWRSRDEDARTI